MTPIKEFQARHGRQWAEICSGPILGDALVTVNASLLDEITRMSPAEIALNGVVTLAKLQGQLLHERALIDLSIIHPDQSSDLPEPTYPNPEEEFNETAGQDEPIRPLYLPRKPLGSPKPKAKVKRRKKRKHA